MRKTAAGADIVSRKGRTKEHGVEFEEEWTGITVVD